MRLHPRLSPNPSCPTMAGNPDGPALVGVIGLPWLLDLDLTTVLAPSAAGFADSERLLVEDLSFPAHRVLDRLLEIEPSRVVLIVARSTFIDPPGTLRRRVLDLTPPPDAEVHRSLVESVTLSLVDLDHILDVARYWKGLPTRTVVIEVEPHDRPPQPGDMEVADEILAMVGKELAPGRGQAPHRPRNQRAASANQLSKVLDDGAQSPSMRR